MTDHDAMRQTDSLHAGEDEPGLLTQQTPGLDEGETAAIAGPDWDDDLAQGAEGEPLDGEVESEGGATAMRSSADPQAGLIGDDDSREPESARPLHPRTGEPFGP
jgi:hypothetical protein